MKIDFFSHGLLANDLEFSMEYTKLCLFLFKKSGLDAIVLTEDFDSVNFENLFNYILTLSKRDYSSLIFENKLRIFPAMKVKLKEGTCIQVIGHYEDILSLRDDLKENKSYLKSKYLFEKMKNKNLLLGLCNRLEKFGENRKAIIKNIDFFILDALSISKNDRKNVLSLEKSYKKPILLGSNSRHPLGAMTAYTEFKKDIKKIDDLRFYIKRFDFKKRVSKDIKKQLVLSSRIKRNRKAG